MVLIDLERVKILVNTLFEAGYSYLNYFIPIGMSSDCNYHSGISHLAEHLVTDLLYDATEKKWQLMNAYVKKDYTCFHGQVLNDDFCEIVNLFMNLSSYYDRRFDEKRIDYEKKRIFAENEKSLSNERLLDCLYLEQMIYNDNRKNSTLLDEEDFHEISLENICEFINKEYVKSKHCLVISTNKKNYEVLLKLLEKYPSSTYAADLVYQKALSEKIKLPVAVPSKTYHSLCIELDGISSIHEYCVFQVLISLYRLILLSGVKEDSTLTDISQVLQYDNILLCFTCKETLTNILPILQTIELADYETILSGLVKKVMFGNLKQLSEPSSYNNFAFKLLYYYNILFDVQEMICCYKMVTMKELLEFHSRTISGRIHVS